MIMRKEEDRVGFKIKVVEKSATLLAALLSRPDLSGCLFPDCRVEDTGTSHNRAGANYTETCNLCDMRYRGETGINAHARLDTHEKQIRGNLEANSMACDNFKNLNQFISFPSLFHFCIHFLLFLTSGHKTTCLTRMLLTSKNFTFF